MGYDLFLKGAEGEYKTFPMDMMDIIKVAMDKRKTNKDSGYWEIGIKDIETGNEVSESENLTLEVLTRYGILAEKGIPINQGEYKGGRISDFILSQMGENGNSAVQDMEDGFNLILREDFEVKAVLHLINAKDMEDTEDSNLISVHLTEEANMSRAKNNYGSISSFGTDFKVSKIETEEGFNIGIDGDMYRTSLVYKIGDEVVTMSEVTVGLFRGDTFVYEDIARELLVLGNVMSMRTIFKSVGGVIDELEDDLKKMMIDELRYKHIIK